MSLLEELNAKSGSYDIAIIAATISILLGGLLFGLGLGFGVRRMRLLGAEEIGQGIISAAMVGALFAFTLLLDSTVPSLVPSSILATCPSVQSPNGSPYSFYMCNLESIQRSYQSLSDSLSRSAEIAGFAGSLQVSAGIITAQPFFALKTATEQLQSASQQSGWLSALAFFEYSLADVVRSSALSLFLPAGLILRTFFATRKLGAAAMALAVTAYLIYPLLFLHTFTVSQSSATSEQAAAASSQFNSDFASLPLLELDETGKVRDEINAMSQGKFGEKVQAIFPLSYRAISLANADLVVFPIVSLLVSLVCALELYRMLSAPIFLPYFEAI